MVNMLKSIEIMCSKGRSLVEDFRDSKMVKINFFIKPKKPNQKKKRENKTNKQ